MDYTEKLGLLKRAQQLAGDDFKKDEELYQLLSTFVTNNEINNNDNIVTLKKRNGNGTTIISCNKVVYKRKRSTKRIKGSHEG